MSQKDAIERALQLYAWGYDEGDMEMLAEALTDDCQLLTELDTRIEDPETAKAAAPTVGKAAIIERLAGSRKWFDEQGQIPRHVMTNMLIVDSSETEATVWSYYLMGYQAPEGLTFAGLSRYVDTFVEDGGAWRIKVRRNVVAHQGSRKPA